MQRLLARTIIRESHALDGRIAAARSRSYASPRVRDLLRELARLNTAVRSRFVDFSTAGGADPWTEAELDRLAPLVMHMRHQVMPVIEAGSVAQRPVEVMLAVEEFCERVLGTDVVVLAQGAQKHTYEIGDLWGPLRGALPALGIDDALPAREVTFLLVRYPSVEKDNVLLHANLIHEAAHPIIEAGKWDDLILNELLRDDALRELRSEVEGVDEAVPAFATLSQDAQDGVWFQLLGIGGPGYKASGILRNWLGEFLADAVAVVALGPAAVFAFADVFNLGARRGGRVWARTHPRLVKRFELQRAAVFPAFDAALAPYGAALEYLEETHANAPDTPEADDGFEETDEYRIRRSEKFFLTLETVLDHKRDRILDISRSKLDELALGFSPAAFATEVPGLVERLRALIPPSEVKVDGVLRPASYAAIVNAGTLVARHGLDDLVASVGRLARDEAAAYGAGQFRAEELVCGLVRKAIGDAVIQRRWRAASVP